MQTTVYRSREDNMDRAIRPIQKLLDCEAALLEGETCQTTKHFLSFLFLFFFKYTVHLIISMNWAMKRRRKKKQLLTVVVGWSWSAWSAWSWWCVGSDIVEADMGVVETGAAVVVVVWGAIVVVVVAEGISRTTATAFDSVLTQNVNLFST